MIENIKRQIEKNPFHIILGAVCILFGIYLLFKDSYYSWPPSLGYLINSDFWGTWSIFNGIGLLYVAFSKEWLYKADRLWLMSTAGFLGFETAMELAHVALGYAHHTLALVILAAGYLLLTFALAKKHN